MRRSIVLPDYASQEVDARPINKVGVRGVEIERKWGGEHVITKQNAYVSLRRFKGIHMSRLVDFLLRHEHEEIDVDDDALEELAETHGDCDAYWKVEWKDIWRGEQRFSVGLQLEGRWMKEEARWYLMLDIPYASVCPCSAAMCRTVGKGIPHMQRSHAVITLELCKALDLPWMTSMMIAEVVDVVKLVPTVKLTREQELEWCKRAEETNFFVEDAAREIANVVDTWDFASDWVIMVEHEESIHQHNAVAVINKGRGLI